VTSPTVDPAHMTPTNDQIIADLRAQLQEWQGRCDQLTQRCADATRAAWQELSEARSKVIVRLQEVLGVPSELGGAGLVEAAELIVDEVGRLRANQTAVFGHATIDKLREMYGPGRSRNATIEMLLAKIEELSARPAAPRDEVLSALRKLGVTTANRDGNDRRWSVDDLATDLAPLLAARPAAAPTTAPICCGIGDCLDAAVDARVHRTHGTEVLIPLCREHGVTRREGEVRVPLARPAAESVAVPREGGAPERGSGFVVFASETKSGPEGYYVWLQGWGVSACVAWHPGRHQAALMADRLRAALADAAAHWPRAVSSEEVERLRGEVASVRGTLEAALKREAAARAQGAAEGWLDGLREARRILICKGEHDRALHVDLAFASALAMLEERIRARAAAAGAEGQTSVSREVGVARTGDPPSENNRDRSDSREQTGTSPPPCAACGGSGQVMPPGADPKSGAWSWMACHCRCTHEGFGLLGCPTCDPMTGPRPGASRREPAPPPASSATAGEDDVEAPPVNHDEAYQLACAKRQESNLARCYLDMRDLVRSERRRALANACERIVDLAEGLFKSGEDRKSKGACMAAEIVRALGGEEG